MSARTMLALARAMVALEHLYSAGEDRGTNSLWRHLDNSYPDTPERAQAVMSMVFLLTSRRDWVTEQQPAEVPCFMGAQLWASLL